MTKVRSGDRAISKKYKYQAFISYAHKDEAVAARLHRALETYRIPKNTDVADEKSLSPIFRDTAELTAHHSLSEKIREAVQGSRVLIVICSPAAKASHWVNEEIRLFRALHGEGSILCVLAEGTPETSFPRALIEEGREPLAANLGASKESFRLGTTQLAASMLGVGLDVLIQREGKRRRRRLQLITAFALIFSGVMGATALTAIDARNDAQNSRSQAEGLVEYMITDLKDKLEPVGRLDILDSVGDEAVKYYDAQNIEALSDESLARQASARHILGQVALNSENPKKARHEIEAAATLTSEILARNPENSKAIYDHAQSEYWVGEMYRGTKNYDKAMPYWEAYLKLGQKLYEIDPSNFNWVMERAWGSNNVAFLHFRLQDYNSAQRYYLEAIEFFENALKISPDSPIAKRELANAQMGASDTALKNGNFTLAKQYSESQLNILKDTMKDRPQDINLRYRYHRARLKLYILESQFEPLSCDNIKSSTFLSEFQTYLNHDNINYDWQYDYIKNWYNLLVICPKVYSREEYKGQIKSLLSHANEFLTRDSLAKERAHIQTLLVE